MSPGVAARATAGHSTRVLEEGTGSSRQTSRAEGVRNDLQAPALEGIDLQPEVRLPRRGWGPQHSRHEVFRVRPRQQQPRWE